jgi:multidrug efflux pump subunit AcrA (membrane-fusion protein)
LIVVGLALAGAGCQSSDAKPRAEAPGARPGEAPPRTVRLATVTPASFEEVVEITGTLAADEQVMLATKVPGRLATIEVDLASPVKQGQLIAQIETTDYEFGVQQAQAALGQARAQLGLPATGSSRRVEVDSTAVVRQARATLEEARANEARLAKLAGEGLTPQAELDTARATLVRAEASLEAAREEVRLREAQVRQRESELDIARQRLADTGIYSPIDGFVQARRASRGEYLAAGAPVAEVVRIDPCAWRCPSARRRACAPGRRCTSASAARAGRALARSTPASSLGSRRASTRRAAAC